MRDACKRKNQKLSGLNKFEVIQLTVLSIMIFVLGFASSSILQHTKPTLVNIERSVISNSAYLSELANTQDGVLLPLNKFQTVQNEGVK